MLARNWKRRWHLLCLARQARHVSMARLVVNPIRSTRNSRLFWKPVNPQDCVFEIHYRIISRRHYERWFLIVCSTHWARIISNDGSTVMNTISRLPGSEGQAADAVSAYTQVKNGKRSQIVENSKIGMSTHLDSSTTKQMAKIMVQYGRPSRSSWAKSVQVILWQDC